MADQQNRALCELESVSSFRCHFKKVRPTTKESSLLVDELDLWKSKRKPNCMWLGPAQYVSTQTQLATTTTTARTVSFTIRSNVSRFGQQQITCTHTHSLTRRRSRRYYIPRAKETTNYFCSNIYFQYATRGAGVAEGGTLQMDPMPAHDASKFPDQIVSLVAGIAVFV